MAARHRGGCPSTALTARIVALPGDGVGPEVTRAALAVLRDACERGGLELHVEEMLIGGAAIDATGAPLPPATLDACLNADAVLLGAVGGPKWDHLRGDQRCEHALLSLRQAMQVFANLRPVRVQPGLEDRGPLRPDVVRGTDLIIVRELTGGAYFGTPRERSGSGAGETARDSIVYTAAEIARVARMAFRLAAARRGRLVSVDKANVLITSQLWRDTVAALSGEFPTVQLEHQLVDSFAMELITHPASIDVVVTENLFGDILSDEAGVLAGSLGMLPSACLGVGHRGLYEPVHGSAPSLVGRGVANPYGAILSIALLLRHSLQRDDLAVAVEAAVDACIAEGVIGPDLGGEQGTEAITAAVRRAVAAPRVPTGATS
jgi:3-isopropylmalate dehydrogenase